LGVCLFVLSRPLTQTSGSLLTPARLLHLAVITAVSGGLYLVLGYLFKVEEMVRLVQKLKQRLRANQ
jgi:hypothetical protein